MMDLEALLRSHTPQFLIYVAPAGTGFDQVRALANHTGTVARILRGNKALTCQALFDEGAAACQFPPYFGDNWDAFLDCLRDLRWLPGKSMVLVVTHALHLLEKEAPEEWKHWAKVVQTATQEMSQEVPPRSLQVVLHATAEEEAALRKRLQTI